MKDIMYTKTITKQAIKKELSLIYKQYSESVDIQSTSTRLLNLLVNDMLDFASVQSGKFRKECSNFTKQNSAFLQTPLSRMLCNGCVTKFPAADLPDV